MATEPEAAPLARMSSILIIRLLSLKNGALSQPEACNLSLRTILSSRKPQKNAPNKLFSQREPHIFSCARIRRRSVTSRPPSFAHSTDFTRSVLRARPSVLQSFPGEG